VFVVLSIAPLKKFALITTVDTWCVQMTGATSLDVATFLE